MEYKPLIHLYIITICVINECKKYKGIKKDKIIMFHCYNVSSPSSARYHRQTSQQIIHQQNKQIILIVKQKLTDEISHNLGLTKEKLTEQDLNQPPPN